MTDRLNTYLKEVSDDDLAAQQKKQIIEGKKIQLRSYVDKSSQQDVIDCAQGRKYNKDLIGETEAEEIVKCF